ncbi:MAG: (2Fe-2S)-binding protein [Planctomycetaceae bacterium]
MKLDDELCYCFHVRKRKVVNHLRVHKPSRASQLSDCGGAGTGCGWCVPYLKRLFEQHQTGSVPEQDDISVAEYESGRAVHLAERKKSPGGKKDV